MELMRLFRDSIRCDEPATSISAPCSDSANERVKSRTLQVKTTAEIRSNQVNNL